MVLADSRRVSRARRYSGVYLAVSQFRVRDYYPLRCTFPECFHYRDSITMEPLTQFPVDPNNPEYATPSGLTRTRFRLIPFRSPLLRESFLLSVPQGNEMFQFPWFPPMRYVFTHGYWPMTASGFPHSDISGSKASRRLTGAYRSHSRLSSVVGAKASTIGPL